MKKKKSSGSGESQLKGLIKSLVVSNPAESIEVVAKLSSIVVGKPSRTQFFRVHETLFADVFLFRDEESEDQTMFLISPELASELGVGSRFTIFVGVYRDGMPFLWPINSASSNDYCSSARSVAISATKTWVRMVTDREARTYTKREAPGIVDAPDFSKIAGKDIYDLLSLGFSQDRIVNTTDHAVAKRLRGEA